MNELIERLTQAAGIEADTAQNAVGKILGFIKEQGDAGPVQELLNKIPGAEQMIQQAGGEEGASSSGGGLMGALGGLMGGGTGGLMALAGQLQSLGLDMTQITTVGKTIFEYGKQVVGEETMGKIAASVPGLEQFNSGS